MEEREGRRQKRKGRDRRWKPGMWKTEGGRVEGGQAYKEEKGELLMKKAKRKEDG